MKKTAVNRGFTLIEVICTVAVIGVILSISYPSLSGYIRTRSELDLRVTAEQLLFDIRYVRQQNISESDVKYTIYVYDDHYTVKKSGRGLPVTLKTLNFPQGVTITSNMSSIKTNGIYFTKTGAPSIAGTIYLNKAGSQYTITIQPSTGRAAIKRQGS